MVRLGPLALEERGPLFEGLVHTMLRFYAERCDLYEDLSYWAPAAGNLEVDFVLRRGRALLAVEAKSAREVRNADLRGLRAIRDLPGLVRRVLVHTGKRRVRTADGIDGLPIATFSDELAAGSLWP